MKIAFFDTHKFDRTAFSSANERLPFPHELKFLTPQMTPQTAVLARGYPGICVFVNDHVDRESIEILAPEGLKLIALRCAGFNNVDLAAAAEHNIKVVRVPAYSPHAVAEHALALLLALNRKIFRAYNRVRDLNFSLDGLVGFDLYQKTVGVVGTGKIGEVFCRICRGLGMEILAYDPYPKKSLEQELGLTYTSLAELYRRSQIISLHVPLTPETHRMINENSIRQMLPGVIVVNTSRGGLIDTRALIEALKMGHIGGAALDVYEEEEGKFFLDRSDRVLEDDVLARLLTFPNVLVTSHQAFLTEEALGNIASTTLENITAFEAGDDLTNEVRLTA
jgi:D-lactate dehydrogenase